MIWKKLKKPITKNLSRKINIERNKATEYQESKLSYCFFIFLCLVVSQWNIPDNWSLFPCCIRVENSDCQIVSQKLSYSGGFMQCNGSYCSCQGIERNLEFTKWKDCLFVEYDTHTLHVLTISCIRLIILIILVKNWAYLTI